MPYQRLAYNVKDLQVTTYNVADYVFTQQLQLKAVTELHPLARFGSNFTTL